MHKPNGVLLSPLTRNNVVKGGVAQIKAQVEMKKNKRNEGKNIDTIKKENKPMKLYVKPLLFLAESLVFV